VTEVVLIDEKLESVYPLPRPHLKV